MIRDQVKALIDLRRRGLEIGALHRPIVRRGDGPVEYVDRATRAELRRWYGGDPEVSAEDIVEVDHVWGDRRLIACVGGERAFGYLVASHVIEHVPDLFGWLGEVASVLADGGTAVFVVPDKRYTFDRRRRTSGEAELVDAYVRGLRRPDPRQIYDHFANLSEALDDAPPERAAELADLCAKAQASCEYVDVHCWVFTPGSLLAALDLGSRLGALPFEVAALAPTEPGAAEFLCALRRLPEDMTPGGRRDAFLASVEALTLPEEPVVHDIASSLLLAKAEQDVLRMRAMEHSTSWRITAPLRAAATWLRARRPS